MIRPARLLPFVTVLACGGDVDTEEQPPESGDLTTLEEDEHFQATAFVPHLEALQAIADANNGNRAVNTSGYAASLEYVEETLQDLGFETERQEVPITSYEVDDFTLSVGGTTFGPRDAAPFEFSASADFSAPIVGVDLVLPAPSTNNTSSSGCEASDFEDFPEGAIALIQRGTCFFQDKYDNALAAGASAVFIFNEGTPNRTDLIQGQLNQQTETEIPAIRLSFDAGAELAEATEEVAIDLQAEFTNNPTFNLLAELPGTQPEFVLVGAHLDSVPQGPGINDNGTGVSMLLQLASYFSGQDVSPTYGIRFAFWGAEEIGLIGSLHNAANLSDDDLNNILANLNFDMMGSPNPMRGLYDGDQSDFIAPPWLTLDDGSIILEDQFIEHFAARGLESSPVAFEGRSDYVGFAQLGIPVAATFAGAEAIKGPAEYEITGGELGQSFDACYHKQCDTIDNIDFQMIRDMALAAADVLDQLSFRPVEPTAQARFGVSRERERVEIPTWSPFACHGHQEVELR